MARRVETVNAGPMRIRVTQLPMSIAMQAMSRVGRIFGAAIGADGEIGEFGATVALVQNANDVDYVWLRDQFLANSKRMQTIEQPGGMLNEIEVPLKIEAFEEIDDGLTALVEWFRECARVNFATFFKGVMSFGLRLAPKTPEASTSLTDSTGSSGGASSS